jgi:hypothetical protein
MIKDKLAIEYVSIDRIKLSPYNPRKFNSKKFQEIKESVDYFGLVEPLVVNKKNNIIVSGNQRFKVAVNNGYTEVPVIFLEFSDDEEKALNIIMNKLGMEFDELKVQDLMFELKNLDIVKKTLSDLIEKSLLYANPVDPIYPEIEFVREVNESYNYIVVIFDKSIDFVNVQSMFDLKPVYDVNSSKKIGMGRVVLGDTFLKVSNEWTK